MCTAFFAVNPRPGLRLLLLFNRDEFFDRATAPAGWWEDAPGVCGGRDLKGGGTWAGVTRSGRFALLTNFRERCPNSVAGAPSRGELPTRFLRGTDDPLSYLNSVDASAHNGFNLVVGDVASGVVAYLTNRGPGQRGKPILLGPGVHGMSNGTLGGAPWAKVDRGVAEIEALLKDGAFDGGEVPWGPLFGRVMGDTARARADRLPATGVPPAVEAALSPTFVTACDLFGDGCVYGTRSQTGVAVFEGGDAALVERSARTRDPNADPATWTTVEHEFDMELGGEGGGDLVVAEGGACAAPTALAPPLPPCGTAPSPPRAARG